MCNYCIKGKKRTPFGSCHTHMDNQVRSTSTQAIKAFANILWFWMRPRTQWRPPRLNFDTLQTKNSSRWWFQNRIIKTTFAQNGVHLYEQPNGILCCNLLDFFEVEIKKSVNYVVYGRWEAGLGAKKMKIWTRRRKREAHKTTVYT